MNETLDEHLKRIEIESAQKRYSKGEHTKDDLKGMHEAGIKLSWCDYYALSRDHLKRSADQDGFPDFGDMKDNYEEHISDLTQRRLSYLCQLTRFTQATMDLNQNDPIEETMIDDWNFGKRCQLEIDLLEAQINAGLLSKKSEGNKEALNNHKNFKHKDALCKVLEEIELRNLHMGMGKTLSAISLILFESKVLTNFSGFKKAEKCIYEYFGRTTGKYKPNDLQDEIIKLKDKYHFFNDLPSH